MGVDEKLLDKAKELGIEVDDDTTEEDLKKAIEEKEKEGKDKDKKDKDPERLEAELKRVIAQRDSAKADRKKLKKKLEELEEIVNSAPKKEDFEKMMEELKELREFRETKIKEEDERELEKKSELEKAEIRFNKQLEDLKKEMESSLKSREERLNEFENMLKQKEEQINRLRYSRLDSEIMQAAVKYNAYSPAQIVKLTKDMFEYDENLDKFFFYVKDKSGKKIVDELTVEEAIKEFLEDESNDNLVRSDVKGGTDHKGSVVKTDKGVKEVSMLGRGRSSNRKYSPDDEDVKKEAEEKGLTPEDVVELRQLRDAKLYPKKEEA